jgi:hypothetical protein
LNIYLWDDEIHMLTQSDISHFLYRTGSLACHVFQVQSDQTELDLRNSTQLEVHLLDGEIYMQIEIYIPQTEGKTGSLADQASEDTAAAWAYSLSV